MIESDTTDELEAKLLKKLTQKQTTLREKEKDGEKALELASSYLSKNRLKAMRIIFEG